MTDAKFSDIDKKVYPTEECYKVTFKNYGEKTFIEFDIHRSQKSYHLIDLVQLALQNGSKWYQWKNIEGKLEKIEAEGHGNVKQDTLS